jgi:hypothetical protein
VRGYPKRRARTPAPSPNRGKRRRFRIYYEEVHPVYVEVVATSKATALKVARMEEPGDRRRVGSAPSRRRAATILREELLVESGRRA